MLSKFFSRRKRASQPALTDPDGDIRLQALAAIAEPTEREVDALRSLARSDPDLRVRRRAIEHLTDSSLLRQLLDDEAIAEAAAARLVVLNPDISEPHPALVTAQLSQGHLPDPLTLDELAPEQLVELTIVARGDAQTRLLENRLFQQADTLTLLERASRDKVKNLNRFARDQLDGLKRKRAAAQEHHQRLLELLAALEKHLSSDPQTAGYHAKHQQLLARTQETFSQLESTAAELATHAEEPVAVNQLRQRIAALPVPEEPAAITAAIESTTEDPFVALTAEIDSLATGLNQQTDIATVTASTRLLDERWRSASSVMKPSAAQQARFDRLHKQVSQLHDAHQQLQRCVATGRSYTLTTAPEQADGADKFWRAVSVARKWLQQSERLIRELDPPQSTLLTEPLSQLQAVTQSLQEKLKTVDDACAADAKSLQQKIDKLSEQIANGESKAAQQLLIECRNSLRRLPRGSADQFTATLNQCAGKLGELKDWQTYATTPKREALCAAIAALADTPLAPPDQAARVKDLRRQWRELGPVSQAADRALADQFNADAQRAFDTCRDYFSEQAQVRAANLQAREEICAQLSHYLETTNFEATDIKAAEQILRTARDEWRRFHPVERKAAKALESRFETLQSTLHQQIKDQWDRNLEFKRQIVADAQGLIDSSDPVSQRIETAKNLQRRWRDAGPVPRRPDQQLWQEFRSACDAVFALRDAQKQAADAAVAAARTSARALLDEFTAQLESPASDKQQLRDIEAQFNALHELPERERRELERQFESLRQAHRLQQQALAAAQQAQALETALMQEVIPGTGDTSVSEDELRRLVVEAEIAAELDSAPEDRDLRMSIQVEMMNQRLGSQRSRPDPQSLVTAWLDTGSKPAGSEALRDRLKNVLQALISH